MRLLRVTSSWTRCWGGDSWIVSDQHKPAARPTKVRRNTPSTKQLLSGGLTTSPFVLLPRLIIRPFLKNHQIQRTTKCWVFTTLLSSKCLPNEVVMCSLQCEASFVKGHMVFCKIMQPSKPWPQTSRHYLWTLSAWSDLVLSASLQTTLLSLANTWRTSSHRSIWSSLQI